MFSYRPGLTVSIMAFLCFLLLMTWLMFSLLAYKTAANDLYAQKGEHARTLLSTFVSQLPENLPEFPDGFISPDSSAAIYVNKLSDDPAFTRLTLLDKNGKAIFTAGRESGDPYQLFNQIPVAVEGGVVLADHSGFTRIINVVRNGVTVGRAGLQLSLDSENSRLQKTRRLFAMYFVLDFVMLMWLGSFILSRIVVNPVNRLLTATGKIAGGHYGSTLKVSGCFELASLAEAFNKMSVSLFNKDKLVSEQLEALEKVNKDLHQAREEAIRTEKMASIGLLAAGMAHEIGTPLASIMGYADLAASEQPANPAIQDYSRRITEDCARIDRIVRGLLDYSRPHISTSESTDIRQVTSSTYELLRQQGALKQINFNMTVEDGLPAVKADPHQLQQVLINLLLNGRDALSENGSITLRAKVDRNLMRIDVADNGTGIADADLKYIFDPFFTTKQPGRGTGLGLAIASRIVEGFGGRITVRSVVGKGSCFTIWLPLNNSNLDKGEGRGNG